MDGINVCPIHKCMLVNSSIGMRFKMVSMLFVQGLKCGIPSDVVYQHVMGIMDFLNRKDALFNEENVIGIIEIPSIDLKYPIFEGDGNDQLNNGIGHLMDSAALLEKGNCLLAGHNGSRRGIFFTNLNTIEEKAEVIITTKDDRTRTYEVVETRIVGPYNAAIREQTLDETLTLFTCAYHGTQRFVVVCKVKKAELPDDVEALDTIRANNNN